jgi:hypothetical protein
MAVDIHKPSNFPLGTLEGNYEPKLGEDIDAGMLVALDANGKLVKASGVADEYAMLALNKQSNAWFSEGYNRIACIKENGSFWTSYYDGGATYTPHCKLAASAGGIITANTGTEPIVGRFLKVEKHKDVMMLLFDLVRSN